VVRHHPTLSDHWVLELATEATLSALIRLDDDGDPVFSLPKAELLARVALRVCDPTDIDFRLLPDGGLILATMWLRTEIRPAIARVGNSATFPKPLKWICCALG
jgi:hypothetical protein